MSRLVNRIVGLNLDTGEDNMRTQRGFVLFEMLLGAVVALLIAVWAGQAVVNRVNDAGAQQTARWMLMIRDGVHAYLVTHGVQLRHAVVPADLQAQGYQDWTAPRLSELKENGLLSAGFPERMRLIEGVRVNVSREGECPGEDCRIGALIHSQRAFRKTAGAVDEQMLAQWLIATEGLGGIVHPSQPGVIRGTTFRMSNPPGNGSALPAGTVALSISDNQWRTSAYLRVRDERDPQFQSNVSAQGNVTAQGDITAHGVVSANDYLQLNSVAGWMDSCPSDGAVTRDQWRGLLVCVNNLWQSAARPSGGFSVNSHHGCFTADGRSSANPVTGACSCPAGNIAVQISEGSGIDIARGVTSGYICVR